MEEKTFYPYVLDHKPGLFLNRFLYRLFKRVSFDENMRNTLKQMNREGTVVYAIKYRGQLDYLLYHYNFRRKRLPYPRVAFDFNMLLLLPLTHVVKIILSRISSLFRYGRLPSPYQSGFYKKAIQQGTTSLIFLVDPKGFIRHFIHAEKAHIQFLLETQKEMDRPIFIVPQLVLYKKTPEKDYSSLRDIFFGFKDHPGIIRKIALFFRHHRQAFIDFGQPLNLKSYLENQPSSRPLNDMVIEIRQNLIDSIDNQKRVILGPIMKSRQQIKEIVLMDKRLIERVEKMAGRNKNRLKQLKKEATEYFEEIAADYNIHYILFANRILGWLWKKIFEGIDVDPEGIAKVREWARRGTLIYIPSHKSHIDYLILNCKLHDNHMHIPRIAAGKNLTFWPLGHIFRQSGAFFIRRSFKFKGAKLYSEVFSRYVKALLEEGHPIEFFIEGGRSRNGKLVIPKTGFLSILLQAYNEGFCNDLIFVPTSIIYDRIMEEKSYLKEINGESKAKENIWHMMKIRRLLNKKYGKIYIRFNHPFSLNEYLSKTGRSKDISRGLAFHLIQSMNEVSLVTPLSLIATAILTNHRRGFHASELTDTFNILLGFLKRNNAPLAPTLRDPLQAVQEALPLLIGWKVVDFMEDTEGEEEKFYFVEEAKKMELEYYKNSIIHFFIPHCLVAISLLSGAEEVKQIESIISDYIFLKNLFKNEFVFDAKENPREKIMSIADYFLDSAYLTRAEENEGYKVTKLGFDKLPIWAALSKTFLESYWIAVKSIGRKKIKGLKNEDLLKNMNYLGKRFHKLGVIDHIEALSYLNFNNALNTINEEIMDITDDTEDHSPAIDRLSQLGQRLYELSHYRS